MHNESHGSIFSRSNASGHSGSVASSTTRPSTELEEDDRSEAPSINAIFPLYGDISLEIAQQIHDEFLICKICLDDYDNPKSLACLHTFCRKCIENHISAEVTYNKSADYHHFTCPLCRKRTNLPIGGVRKLPDNFLVSGLADMLSRSEHYSRFTELGDPPRNDDEVTEGDPVFGRQGGHHQQRLRYGDISAFRECEICGQFDQTINRGHSSTPSASRNTLGVAVANHRATSAAVSTIQKATSRCLDCSKILCDQCVKRHREIRVTREHAIFNLATENSIACTAHPDEPVRFYCEACSVCVCVLCTFNDHREHEMKSFGEAIQNIRGEMSKRLHQTQTAIKNMRQWLSVINDAAGIVHKIECDVRKCAVSAIDEIHRQENKLIEQLHGLVGQPTMQAIEGVSERERQLLVCESVYAEAVELLEGQDLNVLLHAHGDIKNKLGELIQLGVGGDLPSDSCPRTLFAPQPICLGHLLFPDDLKRGAGEYYPSELSTPLGISAATQADLQFQPSQEAPRLPTKETASEANVTPLIKQVRHRAINTERIPYADQETNTRPRGVIVSIAFGGDEQVNLVDNYLQSMKDTEGSSQDLAFAAMDNLTRARMRRKLKERWNTIDTSEILNSKSQIGVAKTAVPTNSAKLLHRRLSDNHGV